MSVLERPRRKRSAEVAKPAGRRRKSPDVLLRELRAVERELAEGTKPSAEWSAEVIRHALDLIREALAGFEPSNDWIGPTATKRLLGLGSENTVRAWAERGLLRSRRLPNRRLQLSLEDVLEKKALMEGLSWEGDDEVNPEDVSVGLKGRNQGPAPWQPR